MAQVTYTREIDEAFAGLKADAGFDRVESFLAIEAVDFGLGLVRSDDLAVGNGNTQKARVPKLNNIVITDSAGTFTAGNIIYTVNGVAVDEAFVTDKDTTMANLAASIQALASVLTAVYSSGANTITVVAADDVGLVIVTDLTGITGTMTIASNVSTSNDTIVRGISLQTHKSNRFLPPVDADNNTFTAEGYVAKEAMSTLRKGLVWGVVFGAVTEDTAVFISTAVITAGQFTGTSTNNIAVPTATFRSTTTAAGIAKIEINIP